jgi:hypothetical protein
MNDDLLVDRDWLLREVRRTLHRLAEPAESQLSYLQDLGTGDADELALEFDDVAKAAITAPGLLSAAATDGLRVLTDWLEAMSGPNKAYLWTDDALRSSTEWSEVRRLAGSVLAKLDSRAS